MVLHHGLQHDSAEQRVYGVYARVLANIDVRCVVIIHGNWLALIQSTWTNENNMNVNDYIMNSKSMMFFVRVKYTSTVI